MDVRFIAHDGFAVILPGASLLFDYWKGDLPAFPADRPLLVFASHMHRDHFSFSVFDVLKTHPDAQFVLSRDIRKQFSRNAFLKQGVPGEVFDRIVFIRPDEHTELGPVRVETVGSTDLGVAFTVSCDGRTVFHAGDLNLWYFEDDTPEERQAMSEAFERELAKLRGRHFDAAFFPVDPRLRSNYAAGAIRFMQETDAEALYPMHCWGDARIPGRLAADPAAAFFRDRIRTAEGQSESRGK